MHTQRRRRLRSTIAQALCAGAFAESQRRLLARVLCCGHRRSFERSSAMLFSRARPRHGTRERVAHDRAEWMERFIVLSGRKDERGERASVRTCALHIYTHQVRIFRRGGARCACAHHSACMRALALALALISELLSNARRAAKVIKSYIETKS